MSTLIYKGTPLSAQTGESVLDCLVRNEVPVRSSCRAGVCQSCLVQGKSTPPPATQKGLARTLVTRNFFLACQCAVEESPELVCDDELPSFPSRVLAVEELRPEIYRVFIERPSGFEFLSGQFVHVTRPADGLTRSYSIASRETDEVLELHVARLPGGEMSGFVTASPGAPLELRGPAGDCVYSGRRDESLLLVGTGTGLAPLLGVVRTALDSGHAAPIHLLHGATSAERLYLREELRELDAKHEQFTYTEDVLGSAPSPNEDAPTPTRVAGGLPALVTRKFPDLKGYRVYLCGNPELVRGLKRQCFLAGAAMQAIHSDPFVLTSRAEGA